MSTSPEDKVRPLPGKSGSSNCLPIGTRLSDFEITGVIGEGGFGIVYMAFDHSLQRTVAIKEYMPMSLAARGHHNTVLVRAAKHLEAFDTGLKSYINEARLLAQFDYPALVKVYRFWEENKTAYMAMQYYQGQTLQHLAEHRPELITESWLKKMLQSILSGLDLLYKAQVLHRDISPENIMIQKNGAPVLLDFGAARQVISGMPQSLTVILKPRFAPVEQYADDESMAQGPWTDIYALSAVIYSLIAKKAPPSSVARMIKDPIENLSTANYPAYSESFLDAINVGLRVLPEQRPKTIAEFRILLGVKAGAVSYSPAPPLINSALLETDEKKVEVAGATVWWKRWKIALPVAAAALLTLVAIAKFAPGSRDQQVIIDHPPAPLVAATPASEITNTSNAPTVSADDLHTIPASGTTSATASSPRQTADRKKPWQVLLQVQ
ncbi:serine/threonine protein kinase [Undibacterium arcticum]|uniref:serine/threonine protein kinase n=1 Tax=Undibacterium arcticum TaxID=1762892 RepID=UPI0036235912